MRKILCRLGFHSWDKWVKQPFKWGWITRQCRDCRKIQDKRLF